MKRIRSFFAVPLSGEVRKRLETAWRPLDAPGSAVRWIPGDRCHLTLKFLGEIPELSAVELLREAEARLASSAPFPLVILGAGVFPSWDRPRVVWAGVTEGREPLGKLAGILEGLAREFSFRVEEHRFRPHVTVGRVTRPPWREGERWAALAEREFGRQTVDRVVLYRSELTSGGAEYTVLGTLMLGGSQP